MKLLFDENLSRRLPARLADLFPGSAAVTGLGLQKISDPELIGFAARNGFMVVTQDEYLPDLVAVRGGPPKVLWIRCGNRRTADIERLLRTYHEQIEALDRDMENHLMMIS